MKIKKFNENLTLDDIKSYFSYAIDISGDFKYEYEEHEGDKIYMIHLSHEFYDVSSYDAFLKYLELVNEIRDVCDKLIEIYKAKISFEEYSNARITIVITYED